MSVCCKCKCKVDDSESIKCDGNCGKYYHIAPECGGRGVSKEFMENKKTNFRMKFYCSECDKFQNISKIFTILKGFEEKIDNQEKNYEEIKKLLTSNKKETSNNFKENKTELKKTIQEENKSVEKKCKEIKHVLISNNEEALKILKESEMELQRIIKDDTKIIKDDLELIKHAVNRKEPSKNITYAEKLKNFANEPMILVKPKAQQECSKTKKDFMTNIDPASIKLNHVREISKGGIALACGSKDESTELVKLALDKLGEDYEVKITELKKPKIKVTGMYEKLECDDIIRKIKDQNEYMQDSDVNVVHTYRGANRTFSAIIEVDGKHFSRVLAAGRLFIHLQSCRVFEDIQVMRCFKCSRFYHKGKDCQHKLACQKCGEEHELSSCKSNVVKCVNCEHAVKTYNVKYDVNHLASDKNCNVYLKKLHMLRRKIEYNK